jgi:hypothetical protein
MKTIFLGLHTRNLGTQRRHVTNPFTGEACTVHDDYGMTREEIVASSNLLTEFGASDPDPDGFRKVVFSSKNYAEVDLGPIGAEIHFEGGLTHDGAEFVFRLALASGMLVCSTIDPAVVAVLPAQLHPDVVGRWPKAAQLGSVDQLMTWIKKEITKGRIVG